LKIIAVALIRGEVHRSDFTGLFNVWSARTEEDKVNYRTCHRKNQQNPDPASYTAATAMGIQDVPDHPDHQDQMNYPNYASNFHLNITSKFLVS